MVLLSRNEVLGIKSFVGFFVDGCCAFDDKEIPNTCMEINYRGILNFSDQSKSKIS